MVEQIRNIGYNITAPADGRAESIMIPQIFNSRILLMKGIITLNQILVKEKMNTQNFRVVLTDYSSIILTASTYKLMDAFFIFENEKTDSSTPPVASIQAGLVKYVLKIDSENKDPF